MQEALRRIADIRDGKLNLSNCGNNRLTALPPLPNTLQGLYCGDNQLSALPQLPDTLVELFCINNPFQYPPTDVIRHMTIEQLKEWMEEHPPSFTKSALK